MRFLTFSFLRSCKFKSMYHVPKRFTGESAEKMVKMDTLKGDPKLVEISSTWPHDEEPELRASVLHDMQVLPDFITESEETALMAELEPTLRRMRYEFDHWDNAIQGFRETERSQWSAESERVLQRVRGAAFSSGLGLGQGLEPLPHTHVLDLAAGGHIAPHVDAVRFCGDVIAGLCLLSDAVMRLQHCERAHLRLDALLRRRSLYVMRGAPRYQFTHAVLGAADSSWRGGAVPRRRRVALICRSRPAALV